MRKTNIYRNVFRGILLISLVISIFAADRLSYFWQVILYIILAIGVVGSLLFEIVNYIKKKRKNDN